MRGFGVVTEVLAYMLFFALLAAGFAYASSQRGQLKSIATGLAVAVKNATFDALRGNVVAAAEVGAALGAAYYLSVRAYRAVLVIGALMLIVGVLAFL